MIVKNGIGPIETWAQPAMDTRQRLEDLRELIRLEQIRCEHWTLSMCSSNSRVWKCNWCGTEFKDDIPSNYYNPLGEYKEHK